MPGISTSFTLPARVLLDNTGKERVRIDTSELEQLLMQIRILAEKGVSGGVPAGVYMAYGGSTAPDGWVFCDGTSYTTTAQPGLFAACGYTYGGSGANFNVPDLRGRALVGLDNMGGSSANRITAAWADTLGGTGGVESVTLTGAQSGLQDHAHSINDSGHTHDVELFTNDSLAQGTGIASSDDAGNSSNVVLTSQSAFTNITIDSSGSVDAASSHTNLQPAMACTVIIKK